MRIKKGYDDDDDDYGEDNDYGGEFESSDPQAVQNVIIESAKNREEQVKLANKNIKMELMEKAIFISKGWFWGFLPHSVRLNRIAEAYEMLNKLVGVED